MTPDPVDFWAASVAAGERLVAERHGEAVERRQRDYLATASGRPVVFASLARCPACGGTKHKSYRSLDQGDGSRMKWTECKSCGEKFIVILE